MLVYRMVCSLFFLCDTPIVCALGAHQSFTNRVGAKIGYSHPRSCSTPRLYSPKNNIFHHNIPTSTMVFECENRYAKSLFFFKHHGFHWNPPFLLFFSLKIAQKSHGFMVYHPIFPGFQWTFLTSRGAMGFPTRRPKIEEARAPKDLPFDGWSMGIKRCAMGTWCTLW